MTILSFCIFYLYSTSQIPIIQKIAFYLASKLWITSLPEIIVPSIAVIMLIFGLFLIFRASSIPSIVIPLGTFIMFLFGAISIIYGLGFFISPFDFKLLIILFSGVIYAVNSLITIKTKNLKNEFIIIYSTILMLYFTSMFLYLIITGAWRNFFGGALTFSLLPYIIFPLFFIIFLRRSIIKQKLKN